MPERQQSGFSADSRLVKQIAPSPNFGERKGVKSPDMIVLHYTGMKTAQGALDWLCAEESQVSCHYLVLEDGDIVQLVAEDKRAWHAGKSCWHGEHDINSRSVGIEIANPGHEHGYVDFPRVQMVSVVELVGDIVKRNSIPAAGIVAHSDIAPLRKEDPGERFDWQMLHRAGLGVWVEPVALCEGAVLQSGDKGSRVLAYQQALKQLGFAIDLTGEFDASTRACTIAFQRRYRQTRIDGVGDLSTVKTLARVLDA